MPRIWKFADSINTDKYIVALGLLEQLGDNLLIMGKMDVDCA